VTAFVGHDPDAGENGTLGEPVERPSDVRKLVGEPVDEGGSEKEKAGDG